MFCDVGLPFNAFFRSNQLKQILLIWIRDAVIKRKQTTLVIFTGSDAGLPDKEWLFNPTPSPPVRFCRGIFIPKLSFFAEQVYSLPIEYYDSIKGQMSDSYSVINQVWMLRYDMMIYSFS